MSCFYIFVLTTIKCLYVYDCQSYILHILTFSFSWYSFYLFFFTQNTGDRCTPNEWFTLEPIKNEESVFAIRHYSTCQLLNVGKDDSIGFADGKCEILVFFFLGYIIKKYLSTSILHTVHHINFFMNSFFLFFFYTNNTICS